MLDAITLALSVAAVAIATAAFFFASRARQCDHAAAIAAHHSQIRELDSDLDDVFDRLKRLTSRKGMAARRDEVKAGAMMPGETPEQWKARCRALKKNGQLHLEEA